MIPLATRSNLIGIRYRFQVVTYTSQAPIMMMLDKNNAEIAAVLSHWLDKR
jgi:hypothetical protein